MFNGIIEQLGKISHVSNHGPNRVFEIAARKLGFFKPGDSIAVDGACMTIFKIKKTGILVEAMPETLNHTLLGLISKAGPCVNLETPLKYNAKINGHLVSGHVDFIGKITGKVKKGTSIILGIEVKSKYLKYFSLKGSVAVNGVSLTISNIKGNNVYVSLVPYTIKHTNLQFLRINHPVNIEIDVLAKYLERLIKK